MAGGRQRRRLTSLPQPASLVDGRRRNRPTPPSCSGRSARHLNVPLDIPALERDLSALTGLDRYQSVDWQMTANGGRDGLLVRARQKPYAPPFLMLGLNIENTTSEQFRVQLAARYLAFDVVGAGSELRIDGGLGADPNLGASLYNPIGRLDRSSSVPSPEPTGARSTS